MRPLDGLHALVTGGSSGIGAAIARALHGAGAKVTIVGRHKARLDEVASSLTGCAAAVADLTCAEDCATMVKAAREAHGPIDILIANAGAAESSPFARIDLGQWQRMIDINLSGAFSSAQAALPDILRDGAGKSVRRIVFIASTAALRGYPYVASYCAAKHGVLGLARAMAAEFASSGMTVNAVCPGFTDTPLLDASVATITAKTNYSAEEARALLAKDNAHQRLITPEEVAQTVVFLCSPVASSINGQAIAIAGGQI
jgi:NAD(P)-dependent dehydrogenase (short-subunit alcohol dehydrogenase family)